MAIACPNCPKPTAIACFIFGETSAGFKVLAITELRELVTKLIKICAAFGRKAGDFTRPKLVIIASQTSADKGRVKAAAK